MLKNFLSFVAVAIGFALGDRLGVWVGSIIGGASAFAASLFVAERWESSREARGYWLRHRGTFLSFGLVVLGITAGAALVGGLWGFLLGGGVGAGLASWLGEKWGWTGPALQNEVEFRSRYLAVLVSAAHADGVITPKELGQIAEVGKAIFSHLGYGSDQDVAGIVATLAARPAPVADVAGYVGALTPEVQEAIKLGGVQEQIRIVSQFRTLMSHCPAYV